MSTLESSGLAYFDWGARDMLVGVRSSQGGWTDNEYRYDGMGSRVSTVESSGFAYYDWDSINVLQEKAGDGTVTERQVHGHAPIYSVGDIAHMDKSGTVYVPTPDQIGTIWHLLDASATKANSYIFDAFGVNRSGSEAVANAYRFGHKRLDSDSQLYHFNARQYSPCSGRFMNPDPLGVALAEHKRYSYASSAPASSVDWAGLWEVKRSSLMSVAVATSDCYDTIYGPNGLAYEIGLEPSEWRSWIQTPIVIRLVNPAREVFFHEFGPLMELDKDQDFLVPNVVLAHWGGTVGAVGRRWVGWGGDLATLRARGFKVKELRYAQSLSLYAELSDLSYSRSLHGLFVWGHGSATWYYTGAKSGDPWFPYSLLGGLRYKAGLGLLCACHSAAARPYFSTGALFWGRKGVLIPYPFHLGCPSTDDLIPPGAQGTNL